MEDDDDPEVIGMVLRHEPPAVAGIEGRPIRDFAEFREANAVAFAAFGSLPPSDEARERARYEEEVGRRPSSARSSPSWTAASSARARRPTSTGR